VTLTLQGGSGYTVAELASVATVGIADNDKVVFDLDVNANGSLKDNVDLAERYLPGYEGDVPKVSTGGSFNTAAYKGQVMKLIVEGRANASNSP
jgi:hypothetical protein